MIPLYGFLQGDTIGLLVLAYPEDTMGAIVEKLKLASSVRVSPREGGAVFFQGQAMHADLMIKDSGVEPLDRIDVRWEGEV